MQPIHSILGRYDLLIATLLVQVAMVAMVASLLLRSPRFLRLILHDPPDRKQRMEFGIVLGVIVAIGAWTRLNLGYTGADLMVIGPLLAGFIMGWDAGLWAGLLGSLIPLRHGEWLTPVVGAAVGLLAGFTRRFLQDPASIWEFSPVPFGNTLHSWRRWRREGVLDPRLRVLIAGSLAEVFRTELARFTNERWLFSYHPGDPISYYAVLLACLTSVGVSLKIWNTPRIEAQLRRQEALLAEARLDALRSQINPHFLFNTLNTVNSLVRTHPDQARMVIVKLSAILRRLLYSQENTCSLRAELDFVDDYLNIELVRFGQTRLKVVKDIEPKALNALVPTMLLQPLVENAIKHGLTPKEKGGVITISARLRDALVEIAVQDNGVGMSEEALRDSLRRGIGLTNVRERLRSLYGESFSIEMESRQGQGTIVRISVPLQFAREAPASTGIAYIHHAKE